MDFKKTRTLGDLRNDPRVKEVYQDSDGYWVSLNSPWHWGGCGTVHEDTIKECCNQLNHSVVPCVLSHDHEYGDCE